MTSAQSSQPHFRLRDIPYFKTGMTALFVATAAIIGLRSYSIVPPNNFGVRVTMGQVVTTEMKPGLYGKAPVFDSIYHFNNNVVNFTTRAGAGSSTVNNVSSFERNTLDQNPFFANFRLHYKVSPQVGLIGLHIDNMSGDNGQYLLTGLMTQSVNAVVGSRSATDTLRDPQTFMKAFYENLQWRIAQNNVPIMIDSVELLDMNAGGLRVPVQARLKSDGHYELMAGPAAIPVPQIVPPGAPAPLRPPEQPSLAPTASPPYVPR